MPTPVETADGIRTHLEILGKRFEALLEQSCQIAPPGRDLREQWQHGHKENARIEFFLRVVKSTQTLARRGQSNVNSPVLQFPGVSQDWADGQRAWVGYRERWECVKGLKYQLIDVGLTFYFGEQYSTPASREQLLRAEWVQTTAEGKYTVAATAAHPHWQIDLPLADMTNTISAFHLGMAGWGGANPPVGGHCSSHWQHPLPDLDALRVWVERTCEYAFAEIVARFPKQWP